MSKWHDVYRSTEEPVHLTTNLWTSVTLLVRAALASCGSRKQLLKPLA